MKVPFKEILKSEDEIREIIGFPSELVKRLNVWAFGKVSLGQ
jgi:hypothetical protein